jgi:CHAD domain-containing protein
VHDAALTLLDGAIETLKSSDEDEVVHAVRKACKCTRAALRLLRECLGTTVYRRENEGVRDAAKPLTGVRDAFMLRKTLYTLNKRPLALQRGVNSEYREKRRSLQRSGARSALEQLARARERLLDLPSVGSEAESAVAGVRRVYKAGRKALRKARHSDDEALHEWRKQAKYLLYQLGLLETVFNAKFGKLRRRADKLAEVLGNDHDLGALIGKLRAYDDRSLMKDIKKRRLRLQAYAFRLGRQLYRHSAKHIEATMAARLLRSN